MDFLQKTLFDYERTRLGFGGITESMDALKLFEPGSRLSALAEIDRTRTILRGDLASSMSHETTARLLDLHSSRSRLCLDLLTANTKHFEIACIAKDYQRFVRDSFGVDSVSLRQIGNLFNNVQFDGFDRLTDTARAFEALTQSVAAITFPSTGFDLSARLGLQFSSQDFFNLHHSDDVRQYLFRTELGREFVAAPSASVASSLVALSILRPTSASATQNETTPRRVKKGQQHRSSADIRQWLEEFELILRNIVDEVMTVAHGPLWVRASNLKETTGWAKRTDKSQARTWCASFAPRREIESAHFSELLTFAFLSDYCAPHVIVDRYLSEAEISADIARLVDARNAFCHGYALATPSQITIVVGILFRLAGVLGLAIDWDKPMFKFARYSTEADRNIGQCERN